VSEQNQTPSKHDKISAQYAEMLISPGARNAMNAAAEAAEGKGEVYAVWRDNFDSILGSLAVAIVEKKDLEREVWEHQRHVAMEMLDGKTFGPFSDYVYRINIAGESVRKAPGDGDASKLPAGEIDVVATNERVVRMSKSIDDPLEYIKESLDYIRQRKQQGGSKFEGPENYATTLKLFSDKTFDHPLIGQSDRTAARKQIGNVLGNFLRVSENDPANIVEVTNVLAAVKNLPPGLVDKRFTPGILKESLKILDEFSQRGLNVLIGAMGKLDVSECAEPAAMTVDLALRSGAQFERSSDLLMSLRAVANLPHTSASERAFTTLLDVRNVLEVAADLDNLSDTNKLLARIVKNTTESQNDTLRAKGVAEYIARRAMDLYSHMTKSRKYTTDDLERAREKATATVQAARSI